MWGSVTAEFKWIREIAFTVKMQLVLLKSVEAKSGVLKLKKKRRAKKHLKAAKDDLKAKATKINE